MINSDEWPEHSKSPVNGSCYYYGSAELIFLNVTAKFAFFPRKVIFTNDHFNDDFIS